MANASSPARAAAGTCAEGKGAEAGTRARCYHLFTCEVAALVAAPAAVGEATFDRLGTSAKGRKNWNEMGAMDSHRGGMGNSIFALQRRC